MYRDLRLLGAHQSILGDGYDVVSGNGSIDQTNIHDHRSINPPRHHPIVARRDLVDCGRSYATNIYFATVSDHCVINSSLRLSQPTAHEKSIAEYLQILSC